MNSVGHCLCYELFHISFVEFVYQPFCNWSFQYGLSRFAKFQRK